MRYSEFVPFRDVMTAGERYTYHMCIGWFMMVGGNCLIQMGTHGIPCFSPLGLPLLFLAMIVGVGFPGYLYLETGRCFGYEHVWIGGDGNKWVSHKYFKAERKAQASAIRKQNRVDTYPN